MTEREETPAELLEKYFKSKMIDFMNQHEQVLLNTKKRSEIVEKTTEHFEFILYRYQYIREDWNKPQQFCSYLFGAFTKSGNLIYWDQNVEPMGNPYPITYFMDKTSTYITVQLKNLIADGISSEHCIDCVNRNFSDLS